MPLNSKKAFERVEEYRREVERFWTKKQDWAPKKHRFHFPVWNGLSMSFGMNQFLFFFLVILVHFKSGDKNNLSVIWLSVPWDKMSSPYYLREKGKEYVPNHSQQSSHKNSSQPWEAYMGLKLQTDKFTENLGNDATVTKSWP